MIRFIGDVHGQFTLYNEIISCEHETLQIGDMGIGFVGDNNFNPGSKDYFINGNHDDPDKCKNYPTFLEKHGMFKNIFYCGGGFSIDRKWRIEGKSWWANEEQSTTELNSAIDLYTIQKPDIVVTVTKII